MKPPQMSDYFDPWVKQSKVFVPGNLYQIKENVLMLLVDEEIVAMHESIQKSIRGPRVSIPVGSIVLCVSSHEIKDRRVPRYTDDRVVPESSLLISETTFVMYDKSYILYVPVYQLMELKSRKFTDCAEQPN